MEKVRSVLKSTLAAESLALLDCAEVAVCVSNIWSEVSLCDVKVHCFIDNKSLFDVLHSSNSVEDKIENWHAVLEDMLDRGEVLGVSWIDALQQLAECLTKRGAWVVCCY